MKRVKDKIKEIEKFLDQLKKLAPSSFEEYKSNIEKKLACERCVEKIIEAITDLAFLVIKYKKLEVPQDDIDAFKILLENKVIDDKLADKLKDAKGMRNIIAHQYGRINDEILYNAITEEIENDVNEFVKIVSRLIK